MRSWKQQCVAASSSISRALAWEYDLDAVGLGAAAPLDGGVVLLVGAVTDPVHGCGFFFFDGTLELAECDVLSIGMLLLLVWC